jgi:hypothetical protein
MNICRHTLGKFKGKKYASKQKKNVLSKSSLKEPIGFKMIMSTIRVKFLEGKEENYFFYGLKKMGSKKCVFLMNYSLLWYAF